MAGLNANTALLLHCNGVDTSTTFTDSSTAATKTMTAVGNAQIDTAQSVFGGASGLFDGNGDYLTTPDHADWDLMGVATQDYTIDFRIKYNTHGDGERWMQQWDTTGPSYYWSFEMSSGGPNFIVWDGVGVPINITGANFTDGNWHHLALIKKGAATAEFGIYNDGVQVAYGSTSSTVSIAGILYIAARNAGTEPLNGWMDEIRIQKENYFNASPNVGLTDTITVPTAEYDSSTTSMKDMIMVNSILAAPR